MISYIRLQSNSKYFFRLELLATDKNCTANRYKTTIFIFNDAVRESSYLLDETCDVTSSCTYMQLLFISELQRICKPYLYYETSLPTEC